MNDGEQQLRRVDTQGVLGSRGTSPRQVDHRAKHLLDRTRRVLQFGGFHRQRW